MRWRAIVLAGLGALALLVGAWLLDWWTLDLPRGYVHAGLRAIAACNHESHRCQSWSNAGILSTGILVAATLLAVVTGALVGLRETGAALSPRLVRAQIMLALLALAGTVVQMAMTPDKLVGAGTAFGGWATLVGIFAAGAAGLSLLGGDDPLGTGALYRPVKVEVPAEVVDANTKLAGATIPPFAMAQRTGTTRPPGATTDPPAAPPRPGPTPTRSTWQPVIRDLVHTEAEPPRRRSTRAPYTAPPAFDAARQSLRFVVAEATIGEAGLAVTLEDHRKVELPWKVFTRASARQLPPGPPYDKLVVVDLGTIGGLPLRFLPSTRVNYADLPGGAAPGSRENLRRLVAHVKACQPTFGIEHDSEAFFAGGREPPALTSVRQLLTYDEQYTGELGELAAPA